MAHSYAKATGVTSNSPACRGPGWRPEYVVKCGDSFGDCNRQTEAYDRGGESSSDADSTCGSSKLVERYADSPACRGTGMKQQDNVPFDANAIVRGYGGQVDDSDSGIGIGSYGNSKPIRPCRSRRYHGKPATSIHGARDELESAIEAYFITKPPRDRVGQDEASDSGVGGGGSGGIKPRPEKPRPCPQCETRAEPLSRNAQNNRHETECSIGIDFEDEAFDTDKGGSTSSGNTPKKCDHSTHLIGHPDTETEFYDSGEGGNTSGGGRPNCGTPVKRKIGECSGKSLALRALKATKEKEDIGFERGIQKICGIVEQDQYDADTELSDAYDGNGGR